MNSRDWMKQKGINDRYISQEGLSEDESWLSAILESYRTDFAIDYQRGYDKANQEWIEKIQKRIDDTGNRFEKLVWKRLLSDQPEPYNKKLGYHDVDQYYKEECKHEHATWDENIGGYVCDNCNQRVPIILSDQPTTDNGWIPVGEKLPKKGKWVQIWRKGLSIIPTNAYWDDDWIGYKGDIIDYVNYWQPLPEPPKTEKP